jgi:hypothetical protein
VGYRLPRNQGYFKNLYPFDEPDHGVTGGQRCLIKKVVEYLKSVYEAAM